MALFKRTKKDSVLPEVDKYYEGERRDRAGLAWLLALVSVIIVAVIIISVFLAGRWLYRQITKDDNAGVAVTEIEAPSFDGGTTDESDDAADDQRRAEEAAKAEAEKKAEEERRAKEEAERGRVDAPARTETPSVPVTGDSGAPLPSTGPANLVGVFAGVTTLAGGIHYVVERRRSK